MTILLQFVFSFFASLGFGVLFNAPRKYLIACGFTGALGWVTYVISTEYVSDLLMASYIAAIVLTFISYFFARKLRTPALTFIVCGIIPLVPGGLAYEAMRQVVLHDYTLAIEYGFEAMLVSGAIAIGIISAETMESAFRVIMRKIGGFQ